MRFGNCAAPAAARERCPVLVVEPPEQHHSLREGAQKPLAACDGEAGAVHSWLPGDGPVAGMPYGGQRQWERFLFAFVPLEEEQDVVVAAGGPVAEALPVEVHQRSLYLDAERKRTRVRTAQLRQRRQRQRRQIMYLITKPTSSLQLSTCMCVSQVYTYLIYRKRFYCF